MAGHTQITERAQELRSKLKTRTEELRTRVSGMRAQTSSSGTRFSHMGNRTKGQLMTKIRARISTVKAKRLSGKRSPPDKLPPTEDPSDSDNDEQVFPLDTDGGFTKATGVFKLRG